MFRLALVNFAIAAICFVGACVTHEAKADPPAEEPRIENRSGVVTITNAPLEAVAQITLEEKLAVIACFQPGPAENDDCAYLECADLLGQMSARFKAQSIWIQTIRPLKRAEAKPKPQNIPTFRLYPLREEDE